ncbi:MAG: hypothetical protein AAF798_20025 [Bacteroidota bacterium]
MKKLIKQRQAGFAIPRPRPILFIIILYLPTLAQAQFIWNGYASQQLGVAHNPLRNPSLASDSIDYTPQLFASYSKLYLSFEQQWGNTKLRIRPKLQFQYYPNFELANYLRGDLKQDLTFKRNKQWQFYQNFLFRTNQRNGDDPTAEVFTIPRSYQRYRPAIGAQLKLNKQWHFKLELAYLRQQFEKQAGTQNHYDAAETILHTQRRYSKGQRLRKLELQLRFQQRYWQTGAFSSETNTLRTTPMQYLDATFRTYFEFDPSWQFRPFLQVAGRHSKRPQQNWYSAGLGASLQWEHKRWAVQVRASAHYKRFPKLLLGAHKLPLRYFYFRNSARVSYSLHERAELFVNVQAIRRLSNYQSTTRLAFQAYETIFCGMGAKISFR